MAQYLYLWKEGFMEMADIVMGCVLSVIAVICGIYFSFTVRCKGPILSNPWIWMSREEREKELAKVDIKAEYRQLTIVFGCLAVFFCYFAAFCFSSFRLPLYPLWILMALIVIYAIGSSVKFAVRKNR